MATQQHPVRERLVQHPAIDHVPASILAALTLVSGSFADLPTEDRTTLVMGVTTIAALVMAAATFVCAMTYQSANILMAQVRQRHADALRRNWSSIIAGCFVAATLPILTLLAPASSRLAVTVCLYSLSLVAARFVRAMFWMAYTLFMDEAAGTRQTIHPAPLRTVDGQDVQERRS